MSKQANPRIVGGFVVGAVALATVAVFAFGSFEFRSDKFAFVVYFDGSVAGLSPGSPVMFRGAKIGEVTDIVVRFDPSSVEPRIPVYMEIDRKNMEFAGREKRPPDVGVPELVTKGLRAKLVTLSMITGQMAVMLDFLPDVPAVYKSEDPKIIEIPSAPSLEEEINTLFEELKKLPLSDVINNINHTVQGIDELIRSDGVNNALASLSDALQSFKQLTDNVNKQVDPLTENLNSTLEAARESLKQAREAIDSVQGNLNTALEDADDLIKNIDGRIEPLDESLQRALKQVDSALASAQALISQDSPTIYRLNDALEELAEALRATRDLANYLERHPEAVLQGKSPTGE